MFKAVVLGLSISCIMLGIQCLAVEQVHLKQTSPTITSTSETPTTVPEIKLLDVQVSPLWAWLLIGIGTSTTFYTFFNRTVSDETHTCTSTSTVSSLDLSGPSQLNPSLTEEEETSWDDDPYETDDYNDTFEPYDESEEEFDYDGFQQEFDIDSLLNESA